ALILRAAGSVAAFLTGTPQPAGDPASGVGVLFPPGDPGAALDADGLNPVVYWIVAGLLLAGLVTGGLWAWLRLRRHTHRIEPTRAAWPGSPHGTKSPPLRLRRRCCAARETCAPAWLTRSRRTWATGSAPPRAPACGRRSRTRSW